MTKKTVFPDTNILLHYPPIDQIDWLKWCQCDEVKIVFCLKVIDELDEKKNHETLSERAKKAIKKIHDISAGSKKITENVVIDSFTKDLGESTASPDEIIIQQVLEYEKTHPDEDVYILSEDLGMQWRCGERVKLIEPDKTQRLDSPSSVLHKENQRLKKENEGLKNSIPDLNLIISADEEFIPENVKSFIAKFDDIPSLEAEEVIAEELNESGISQLMIKDMLTMFYSQKDVDSYIENLRKWANESNEVIRQLNKGFSFNIHVANLGSKPCQ